MGPQKVAAMHNNLSQRFSITGTRKGSKIHYSWAPALTFHEKDSDYQAVPTTFIFKILQQPKYLYAF